MDHEIVGAEEQAPYFYVTFVGWKGTGTTGEAKRNQRVKEHVEL